MNMKFSEIKNRSLTVDPVLSEKQKEFPVGATAIYSPWGTKMSRLVRVVEHFQGNKSAVQVIYVLIGTFPVLEFAPNKYMIRSEDLSKP